MRTLAAVWQQATRVAPAWPAFLVADSGSWREVSWDDAARSVEELAAGFLSLGIRRGDRVAISSRTRLEWTLCDWALISIGALVVPLYPTSSPLECAYVLGSSGARLVICEDAEQLAKLEPARSDLDSLEQVAVMEGGFGAGILSLRSLAERGRELLGRDPAVLERERRAIEDRDALTIVYTSATTGPPKGCLLTNRNYHAMVEAVQRVEGLVVPGDRVLLYLPLAHTFARLIQFLSASAHLTIAFCPDVAGVPGALRELRPTLLPSVPRLFEKLAAQVRSALDEQPRVKRAIGGWALRTGARAAACRQDQRPYPARLALEHALAERLLLSRVRERLGGELRLAISGGAPLSLETGSFLHALGLLVLEGYGLTECTTAASINRPDRYRLGTVGLPLAGVELRIAHDGEILIRGETVFAGYYGDDAATRDALTPDGWLRTGDIGTIDGDGFLRVTGRKKDLIITAGGKNVSPQNIETALEASPFISKALVLGDRRPYLIALLELDVDELGKAASTEARADELVGEAVAAVNGAHGRHEQIRRFASVPRAFSEQAGELTPTLKLRRHVCERNYREQIERLYAARD